MPRGAFDRGWRRIICVASGPSLTDAHIATIQAAQARGWRVLTVNASWERLPFADVLWSADRPFWNVHHANIVASGFKGELWTGAPCAATAFGLNRAPKQYVPDRRTGLMAGVAPPGANYIGNGGNGGAHIVALAFAFGAEVILGAGYDMQRTGGRIHHHADHPMPLANPSGTQLADWARRLDVTIDRMGARGAHFINCTPVSALRGPRGDLDVMVEQHSERAAA